MGLAEQREQAEELAKQDVTRARTYALRIPSPWYRTQALASVAWHASEQACVEIAREALASAATDPDPFQAVGASAWPIGCLVGRKCAVEVRRQIPDLLAVARSIEHPVCRLDALMLLWQAVFPLGASYHKPVLDLLVEACLLAKSWRAGRCLRDTVLILATESVEDARRILARMGDGNYKRAATRSLDAGEGLRPRPFV